MRNMTLTLLITVLISASTSYALTGPATTHGNISVGKFYTWNMTPHTSYPDHWPNQWCSGAKLTDEDLGQTWPLDQWIDWLGYEAYTLEIVLDLGKVYNIDEIRIRLCSRLDYGIKLPDQIRIYTRQSTSESWQQCGTSLGPWTDSQSYNPVWIGHDNLTEQARFVKYELDGPVDSHMFISEIEVYGDIVNSWKEVPDWGTYQGAYPSSSYCYLQIRDYEAISQKQSSMALWYANMGASDFSSYLAPLWTSQYGLSLDLDYAGARYLQVGWEPEANITAQNVASGYYDSYFTTFFLESIFYSYRGGNDDPVWFRPLSEMNGGWTFPGNTAAWGGDPLNFRRAWRRMYNVAEQVGAADHHIFLWSPNGYTYNGTEHMPDKYYPGDQYVDWVGLSLYVQGTTPYPNNILTGTAGTGAFDFYGTYSYKPMMISEGAFRPKDGVDGVEWINQWFDIQHNYPMIKAQVWFYIHDADYNCLLQEPYQSLYRNRIADDYFLRQTHTGILDYNGDHAADFADFAAFSENFQTTNPQSPGDVNGDNTVNLDDLSILAEFWLQ